MSVDLDLAPLKFAYNAVVTQDDKHRVLIGAFPMLVAEIERLRRPTWAEKEAVADEVMAWRQYRYTRSFDIECPKCGMGRGSACILMGNAGGPVNHTERVDAAAPSVPAALEGNPI